jgi:hypothetical protein
VSLLRRLRALWKHSKQLCEHHDLDEKFKGRFSTLEREALSRLKDELFDKSMDFDDDSQCEVVVRQAWRECVQELRRRSRATTPPADLAIAEAFITERFQAARAESTRLKRPKLKVVK